MNGSNLAWLALGISSAVLILSLVRIVAILTIGRRRIQALRSIAQRAEGAEEQIDLTTEHIQASAAENIKAIRVDGEATRGRIAETHKRVAGRDLKTD